MSLEFAGVRYAYGGAKALLDVTLGAAAGEITCLLGASGCGKTTLLRLAAGLLDMQEGEIRLDGEVLAAPGRNPPPEARPVGLVFQEGALFPHMNIARNVAFGVEGESDKAAIVDGLLDQVGLSGFARRYPHTLSGGQQQRVALARALAPAPRVLLLDEPFANVDIVLRRRLREETRRVLKARDAVALLVTHDPEEAMEIGDRIAVMEGGKVLQSGAPQELYDAPAAPTVAALIGDGQMIDARRTERGFDTPFGVWPLSCLASGDAPGKALRLVARPEALCVQSGGGNLTVEDVRRTGPAQRIFLMSPSGARLVAEAGRRDRLSVGDRVSATPKDGAVFAFAAET
ncbi:MAG: ABC transporter ATP-binding protein [Pseudomonadota bacterium]